VPVLMPIQVFTIEQIPLQDQPLQVLQDVSPFANRFDLVEYAESEAQEAQEVHEALADNNTKPL